MHLARAVRFQVGADYAHAGSSLTQDRGRGVSDGTDKEDAFDEGQEGRQGREGGGHGDRRPRDPPASE